VVVKHRELVRSRQAHERGPADGDPRQARHFLLDTITDMIGPLPLAATCSKVRRVQATDVLLLQAAA